MLAELEDIWADLFSHSQQLVKTTVYKAAITGPSSHKSYLWSWEEIRHPEFLRGS